MSLNNSDTRSQSKQIVYNVSTFLKELSSKPDLTADFFKNAQIRTGEACGLSDVFALKQNIQKMNPMNQSQLYHSNLHAKVTNVRKLFQSLTILIQMSLEDTSSTTKVSSLLRI